MKTLVKDICKDVYDNIGAVNIFLSSGNGDKLQLLNYDGYTDEITDYVPNASIDVDNGYFNVTNVLKNIKDRIEEDFEGKTLVFLVCGNKSVVGSRSLSASLLKGLSIMYNVHVSFISKDMVAKEYSYVESIRKTSSAFIFNDFSVGEIKNYIYTEFEPTQFKIITANNYETVKLDSILRKDSKTDTDSDGISDWNEINIELIKHFNSGATDKGYLTMDDMPNLVQIIDHPQKPYVQSGLDRLKSSTDEPYWKWWDKPVVPIHSVPTKVDSDDDGYWDCVENDLDKPPYTIADNQLLIHNKSSNTPFTYIPAKKTYDTNISDLLCEKHQKYLYFLAAEYDEEKKEYFAELGYEIDGYLLIGVLIGESNAGKENSNHFGFTIDLSDNISYTVLTRASSALLSSGIADDESQIGEIMESDSFYLEAAQVLSYMDNSYNYQSRIDLNFSSLIQANPNVARWRDSINSLVIDENAYEYRCYDFRYQDGKYQSQYYPWNYCYDAYVYVNSLFYNTAFEAIREFEEETGLDFWTLKKLN